MDTHSEENAYSVAAEFGWEPPALKSGAELLDAKKESLKKKKGPPPPRAGPPPVYLAVEDVLPLASESWRTIGGWVAVYRPDDASSALRVNVRSPLLQKLLQMRYAVRNQQETMLLQLFSQYAFHNHPALTRCPFEAPEEAESNCCEVFQLVKTEFDCLCSSIDATIARIAKIVGDSPAAFCALAEKDHPDIAVRFGSCVF